MLRQGSSRNQRSKGFKVKHALQIFVLVAICIWLIYQVKHSHEKKRALEEERNTNKLETAQTEADTVRLPRKFLPNFERRSSENVAHKDEENELTQNEEEEETKQADVEDEEGQNEGDDNIDEQDQDRDVEESENGEESTEQDQDSHDGGNDEVDLSESQDHEVGTQEAREENYKRDDASSAVANDATQSEDGSGDAQSADDEQLVDKVDDASSDNGSKGDDDITHSDGFKGDPTAENVEKKALEAESTIDSMLTNNPSNATDTKKNIDESTMNSGQVEFNSQVDQQTNSTTAAESNAQTELQSNSTGAVHHAVPVAVSNDTVSSSSTRDQNASVDNSTTVGVDSHNSESNTTVLKEPEEQHSITSVSEKGETAQGRAVISEEERKVRTDLSTLLDIQNEAKTTNAAAAAG